jgi:hypothetical protein
MFAVSNNSCFTYLFTIFKPFLNANNGRYTSSLNIVVLMHAALLILRELLDRIFYFTLQLIQLRVSRI